jgi:hypothetical protein
MLLNAPRRASSRRRLAATTVAGNASANLTTSASESPEIIVWRDQVTDMIRIALTEGAYDTIASTLPKGSARWPTQRDRGRCFIQVEAAVVDRMSGMRRELQRRDP